MKPNGENEQEETGEGHIGKTSSQEVEIDGETQAAKFTEHTNGVVNESVSHWIETISGQKRSVTNETNMESMGTLKSFTKIAGTCSTLMNAPVLFKPTLMETHLTMLPPMHVTSTNQIGLKENKPRPTWTRLARMDCGPKGIEGDCVKSMLGKRGLQDVEAASEEVTDSNERKKGRRQTDIQKNETIGVEEHPCRTQ